METLAIDLLSKQGNNTFVVIKQLAISVQLKLFSPMFQLCMLCIMDQAALQILPRESTMLPSFLLKVIA